MVTCENCGKEWKVHPSMASRVHACSTTCSKAAYRTRQKQGTTRPITPMAWQPWNYTQAARNKNT